MRGVVVICGWLVVVDGSVDGVCILPSQATDALDKSRSCPSRAHSTTVVHLLVVLSIPPCSTNLSLTSHMPPTDCAFYVYHLCLYPYHRVPTQTPYAAYLGKLQTTAVPMVLPIHRIFSKYRMS